MIPLKKNFSYLILDDLGQVRATHDEAPEAGGYMLDTRLLSQYQWHLPNFKLLHSKYTGSRKLVQYFSRFENHKQSLMVIRTLTLHEQGFVDELHLVNDDLTAHEFKADLSMDSDFVDIFEVRGHAPSFSRSNIRKDRTDHSYKASYQAQDGIESAVEIALSGFVLGETIRLQPRQSKLLMVNARFSCSYDLAATARFIPDNWLSRDDSRHQNDDVFRQAEMDLHDLLLHTKQGLVIAAGIPWFVTPFGRDSIITSWLLLRNYPELAEGTLRFLAANQGQKEDPYRDEQPGKILHEQRYSELSRIGKLPFHTYYGTADATPLFIMLLRDHALHTDSLDLVQDLQPHWQAALAWMETYQNEQGLIVFHSNERGLVVQSWKDSHDSLSYSNGELGKGDLAVAEVQGYAYAAYLSADYFYRSLGDHQKADYYQRKAEKLKATFNDLYWMPEHNNYAIALDAQGRQLDVNSSDSGHLLWTQIVSNDKVDRLVERLFQKDLWSGWGLRTMSTQEKRYNPISYHNGSVWPHDTALFAAGLKRYGKHNEFQKVREALVDVARNQKDLRLPELFAGYPRHLAPILPYQEACRPQAWAAAALVYVMSQS